MSAPDTDDTELEHCFDAVHVFITKHMDRLGAINPALRHALRELVVNERAQLRADLAATRAEADRLRSQVEALTDQCMRFSSALDAERTAHAATRAERDALRWSAWDLFWDAFGNLLLAQEFVRRFDALGECATCAFCAGNVTDAKRRAMREHLETCQEHPVAALRTEVEYLRAWQTWRRSLTARIDRAMGGSWLAPDVEHWIDTHPEPRPDLFHALTPAGTRPAAAREGTAMTWCPQCGPAVAVDEDGCCAICGADAMGPGAAAACRVLTEVEYLRTWQTWARVYLSRYHARLSPFYLDYMAEWLEANPEPQPPALGDKARETPDDGREGP